MFLDSLDHSKHASNLFCAYTTRNEENFVNFSETSFPKSAQIHWFYSKIAAESHLGSMNSQKSLSAHVCRNKNGLERRTITPIVSADRYDPKEACKHKHCGSNAFQNFFGALQLNTSWSPTSSFWGSIEPFGWNCVQIAQKWVSACVSCITIGFWCVWDTIFGNSCSPHGSQKQF